MYKFESDDPATLLNAIIKKKFDEFSITAILKFEKKVVPVAFSEHDRLWLQESALHNGRGVIHFHSPIR